MDGKLDKLLDMPSMTPYDPNLLSNMSKIDSKKRNKPSKKLVQAIKWLLENDPGTMSLRELSELIGIGKDTINKAQKAIEDGSYKEILED